MKILILVAALLCIVAVVALILALLPQRGIMAPKGEASRPSADGTTVALTGSVVTIRHAGSSIAVQVSAPEPVLGPLSDMSLDAKAWDTVSDPKASEAERERCITLLEEQGFKVTREGDRKGGPAEKMDGDFFDSLDIPSPDDGPVGELSYSPLSEPDSDMHVIMEKVVRYMETGRCTPAFAREISRVYHYSLKFRDPAKEEESNDPDLIRMAQRVSETIARDVDAALDEYEALLRESTSQPRKDRPVTKGTEQRDTPPKENRKIVVDGLDWTALHRKRR